MPYTTYENYMRGGNGLPFVPNPAHGEGNPETRNAVMPAWTGVLPRIIRVGIPLTTYRLNKIECPRPQSDYVYFHTEKYCTLDGCWYPEWLKLSLYCETTREILAAVIQASLEKPERAHFMTTLARLLALPDEGPRAEGNPLSTRFHWRGPIHQNLWSWVLQGESPWNKPFHLYPQPAPRQGTDANTMPRVNRKYRSGNCSRPSK